MLLHGGNAANWMWEPQLPAFTDRTVLTPDLPGFGQRVGEDWPGLDAVADDVVARVSDHGVAAPFDLVGLSPGALTAMRVLARHPHQVRSAFVTGASLLPAGAGMRLISRVQLAFWRVLADAVSQAQVRLAPGMHHIWNVEDVDLFNGVLRSWLDGTVDARLVPVALR